MPSAKNNTTAGPAEWVGGRRRKLVRRHRASGGAPRSNTMPVLNPESAAASLVSSVSNVGADYVKGKQSEDQEQHGEQQEPEEFEDKMQFYPPSGAVNFGMLSAPFADDTTTSSPKLTATDSKKKHGIFGNKKPNPLGRSDSSPHAPLVTSPLPVTTPSKAAQFFGLSDTKAKATDSPRRSHFHEEGITEDDDSVRPKFQKRHFLPLLTKSKTGVERQTEFNDEDVEADQQKPSNNGKNVASKGLRKLFPDFAGPRRAAIQKTKTAAARFNLDDEDEDVEFNIDSANDLRELPSDVPTAPQPVPPKSKSRMRKKSPKPFERMSPITEGSFEELRHGHRKSEDVTELSVISEYEHGDVTSSGPVQPRTQPRLNLPSHNAFELDEEDLSPTDRFYDKKANNKEDSSVHQGTKVELKRVHWQQSGTVPLRSPLQSAEDAYLDATEEEMRLDARRMTLARNEAEKKAIDAKVTALRGEHEAMKLKFSSMTSKSSGCACACGDDKHLSQKEHDPDDDDDDLVSIRSSIDLDEEPTVHTAKRMTITRITPGMVKLVDIPPRKKKPGATPGSSMPGPKNPAPVIPAQQAQKGAIARMRDENVAPPSPVITHHHHVDPDRASKPKRSKMTRDESRLLVQNWISDYNSTEQRPISTRVDPDVLADQEVPPAPFPKTDEALPTPPINPRSDSLTLPKSLQKHQCINNGHIFHPVDLKQIPDNAVVNSLQVRPYLQTYTGVKQHVKITVLCESCGKDCDENVWECEIAVCCMAVCQDCAEKMEAEWQERAVSGWKYK